MASGDSRGLELQLRWAIEDRVPLSWLRELLLQNLLFVGYPRTIQALQALAGTTGPAGEQEAFWTEPRRPSLWRKRGRALCARIYGPRFEALVAAMRRLHPDLAAWILEEGYGRVLARPLIAARVRELAVVSLLVAQEAWPQLRAHAIGARHVGARALEVEEAARTGIVMAPGVDKATARRVIRRAVRESRSTRG
jgi:alkylhydroperoxidase/carboxymuconolactone decarboxylase family protein YurZ